MAELDNSAVIGVIEALAGIRLNAGDKLTGKASADIAGAPSQSDILEGKISGDEISFTEMQKYQSQEVKIVYKGKVSGDEIKFTRNVADMANEEFVAKRAK